MNDLRSLPIHAEANGEMELDIVALGITMIMPQEMKGHGGFELPAGGVLIYGHWEGDIKVKTGVVIVARGAVVSGRILARTIYIDGEVARMPNGARSEVNATELIITDAGICHANMICKVFCCGKGATVDGAVQSGE